MMDVSSERSNKLTICYVIFLKIPCPQASLTMQFMDIDNNSFVRRELLKVLQLNHI